MYEDKFDNSKPNIILITDHTDTLFLTRSIGPHKVAHELRRFGYEVAVLNFAHIFTFDEILYLLRNLISAQTLFVGFNNMFYKSIKNQRYEGARGLIYDEKEIGSMLPHGKYRNAELTDFIKSINPACCTVLGGPAAQDIPLNSDFDYVVMGYADSSIVNLANYFRGKEPLQKSYRSVYGPVIINDSTAPDFDFVNSTLEYKSYDCVMPGETLTIEVSRGCIFKCAFCNYPLNGKKKLDFIKSRDNIKNEFLRNYEKHRITRYIFSDDTFNDSIEKIQIIYDISKELPFKLEYWAYARLDLLAAHPETIDLLFDSGLRGCHFGIETFNADVGKRIGKGMPKEKQLAALRYIKGKWGDQVMLHGSFISGLPGESEESLHETLSALLDENCPLDSWYVQATRIQNHIGNPNVEFISKIEQNPDEYGYKNTRPMENSVYLDWENEHMSRTRADEIAIQHQLLVQQTGSVKVTGLTSFNIASLGFDLSCSTNTRTNVMDWSFVDAGKQRRIVEYKQRFYSEFNMPPRG